MIFLARLALRNVSAVSAVPHHPHLSWANNSHKPGRDERTQISTICTACKTPESGTMATSPIVIDFKARCGTIAPSSQPTYLLQLDEINKEDGFSQEYPGHWCHRSNWRVHHSSNSRRKRFIRKRCDLYIPINRRKQEGASTEMAGAGSGGDCGRFNQGYGYLGSV